MAFIRFLDATGRQRTIELRAEPVTFGRAPTCQVVLDHELVSREHARIETSDGERFVLRDLASRNKTYVNGQAVGEVALVGGDILRIGESVVEFIADEHDRLEANLDFLTPDRTEPPNTEWLKAKTPLPLTLQQIEQLSNIGGPARLLSRAEDIADAALGQLLLDTGAERGFIALRGEGKRDLRLLTQRGLRRSPGGSLLPVSQSFVYATVLQHVAGRYPDTVGHINLDLGYASAGLVAPLTFEGEIVGVVYLDRPADKRRVFSPATLIHAAAAGAHIGALMGLATRRLAEQAPREEAAWIATLRRLQTSLTREAAGNDFFALASARLSGRCRCGDLLDVIPLDERRLAVLLLDCGGSGIVGWAHAAAVRAAIATTLRNSDDALLDPAPIFNAVNALLASLPVRQPIAVTYVGIDLAPGKLAYVTAGGASPRLAGGPGRLVVLEHSSLLLGVDSTYTYETRAVDLTERFRVVCVSDGVIEATGGGEAFGDERLHERLMSPDGFAAGAGAASTIIDAVRTHLAGSAADDDATVVIIARD